MSKLAKKITKCLILVAVLFSSALLSTQEANAAPLSFQRPRMTFSLGLEGLDYFVGDFGAAADPGMSISGDVTIQIGYFGGNIRFGSARCFTNKDFLPYDEAFQQIFITAAPRFYFPPFRTLTLYLFVQPQISMRILESNTLVKITENDSLTGGVGGAFGLQYIAGILAITGQVAVEYDWRLNSVLLTGGISIGLSNTIE